jgi:MFS family permease
LVALLADHESYGALVPGMAILGLGIGLFYPTATTVGVTAVDEARRSLGGAILYMFQIAGGSVGLGLTTTVFIGASDRATGATGFIDGIETAFALDAAIAVGGFLIAAFLIGGRIHLPHVHRPALAGHSPRGHGP